MKISSQNPFFFKDNPLTPEGKNLFKLPSTVTQVSPNLALFRQSIDQILLKGIEQPRVKTWSEEKVWSKLVTEIFMNTPADDPEHKRVINEFADLVIKSLESTYHNELEPFNVYADKVRHRIFSNVDEFRKKFTRGYTALYKEIEKNK